MATALFDFHCKSDAKLFFSGKELTLGQRSPNEIELHRNKNNCFKNNWGNELRITKVIPDHEAEILNEFFGLTVGWHWCFLFALNNQLTRYWWIRIPRDWSFASLKADINSRGTVANPNDSAWNWEVWPSTSNWRRCCDSLRSVSVHGSTHLGWSIETSHFAFLGDFSFLNLI